MLGEAPADSTPVYFRSQPFRARKTFWHGTQRTRSPQETLDLIRPYFGVAGITRLANITGLDRIGIPTVISVRPNSPTLSTSAGKGFSIEAAMTSAAMEAIELYHAENAELDVIHRPYAQLAPDYQTVPIEHLPLNRNSLFHPSWPYHWVLGWDIIGQQEVAVPLGASDLVFTSNGQPTLNDRIWDLNSFPVSSNGLASGNDFLEALASGLYEVIERDGATLHGLAEKRHHRPPPVVRLETITHPLVLELIERCRSAGVTPMIFDCTVDTCVPIYRAYVYETDSRHHLGVYKGYGAHLDPGIAMIRALTEAIQSRLIYIAGSRDDIFRNNFMRIVENDSTTAIDWFEAMPATVDAQARTSTSAATFEGDIVRVLENLVKVGITRVIVFDLTLPGWPISVARVFVPGLEGYKSAAYAPGQRARAFCEVIGS